MREDRVAVMRQDVVLVVICRDELPESFVQIAQQMHHAIEITLVPLPEVRDAVPDLGDFLHSAFPDYWRRQERIEQPAVLRDVRHSSETCT